MFIPSDDFYNGLLMGLAYAIAQNNDGKATMTLDIPEEEGFDPDRLHKAIYDMADLDGSPILFDFNVRTEGGWTYLTFATTENYESMPDDFDSYTPQEN